jgi:hypothetical protein
MTVVRASRRRGPVDPVRRCRTGAYVAPKSRPTTSVRLAQAQRKTSPVFEVAAIALRHPVLVRTEMRALTLRESIRGHAKVV